MNFRILVLMALCTFIVHKTTAQRNYDGYNRLGITGGVTLFDISTSDLETKASTGFTGGFTTRGSVYNNFDLIYGLSFTNSEVGVLGNNLFQNDEQYIDYTIQAAQLGLLLSYNIVRHHLSVEFGPSFTVNSKLNLNSDRFENYILDGYTTLLAKDIQDISTINVQAAGGITAGFETFRISGLYQYGVTNMLNKLNDKNLENKNFKGNSTTFSVAATFYF